MTVQRSHAASFVTSFVLEGIQRCSGIFFSWTLDQSGDSRQKTAIPFAVGRATAYIASVAFKDFLRNRGTSLQCGIFLGILGTALSFISSDFIWMTICWGIIIGAGIGISSPEALKVSPKFRTQPFLLLICCAAPSFACILLPFLLQFLLSCYGLCGCLLILSGMAMNAVPFIMVSCYGIRFQLGKPLWKINDIGNQGADNVCFEMETSSAPDTGMDPAPRKTLPPTQEMHAGNQIEKKSTEGDFNGADVLLELNSRNQNCRNTVSEDGRSMVSRQHGDTPTEILPNNLEPSTKHPPNLISYPLEIKVHVVECTFTGDDVRDGRLLTRSVPNIKKGGYRRHSNSLITYQYNNFSPPNFSQKYSNGCSSHPSPNMYLISEDDELAVDLPGRNNDRLTAVGSLRKMFEPTCLVVIYAFVIHEVTLVMLLTIFDDHIDGLVCPATGVLPAFGLGGILGRLSVKYWGDKLEVSHATSALLFILDGVVVAGILRSPNIYWIGGFYAALGFLEIGISTAVWNLVTEHIDVDAKSTLFTTCKLLCGICSLFVPYTIGLSRDVMGEYDGLLQVTSGLSVLCAILCYILPKFTFHVKHTRGS